MGIRNTTKEKHDLTLGRRISAAAKRLLPADRRSDVGGDAQETSKANQPAELVLSVLKMWGNKMRRSFCPPLAIRYGSPDRRIKEKRMEDTFKSLDRAARSFLTAYAILAGVNVTLLPEGQFSIFCWSSGPRRSWLLRSGFTGKAGARRVSRIRFARTLTSGSSSSSNGGSTFCWMEPSAPRRRWCARPWKHCRSCSCI